jgi:hypothetical protein
MARHRPHVVKQCQQRFLTGERAVGHWPAGPKRGAERAEERAGRVRRRHLDCRSRLSERAIPDNSGPESCSHPSGPANRSQCCSLTNIRPHIPPHSRHADRADDDGKRPQNRRSPKQQIPR